MSTVKERLQSKIDPMRSRVRGVIKEHGDQKISDVTIRQAYGGMRGVKCIVTETSALDPYEGIRFRGFNIPELREKLPKAPGGEEPIPEGIFYLLLTGDLPTEDDVKEVRSEWDKRCELPDYLIDILKSIPKETHPMTQFSQAILALQKDSVFAKSYREGMSKMDYWDPMYEDAMNILAKLPRIAAYIYRKIYKNDEHIPADPNLDWAGNFAQMLGVEGEGFKELLRLYLVIHSDHEGGNVSAHTTHLVGSTLSDAYYALASSTVKEIKGILNGTTNYILTRMEEGLSYKEALKKAQELGYAEAVPDADVLGWDALAKVTILAKVIFDADRKPFDYPCEGITGITASAIADAKNRGKRFKLIGKVWREAPYIKASVSPEEVDITHPLAGVMGATNAITITTDTLGDITVVGPGAGKKRNRLQHANRPD